MNTESNKKNLHTTGSSELEERASGVHREPGAEPSLLREKEYYEFLLHELKAKGGANVDVDIRDVRKNNGIRKKVCTIRFAGAQVAPTVYLDPYYNQYMRGECVSESAKNILNYCREKTPDVTFPEDFFQKFESVKKRIGIKLIGRQENEDFLREVPSVPVEDMAAVFYYLLEERSFGNGMIYVKNTDMERWQMTPDQLFREALKTCPDMLPPVFRPLSDMLEVLQAGPSGEGELFLLTNKMALYGASVILYPGILQEIANYIGKDFFILPSSVHEVILLPDGGEEPEGLLQIVTEINHTQVAEEEVLTDAVYHFTSGSSRIVKLV